MQLKAKPFVKWAGGKGQLLGELEKRLPSNVLKEGTISRYVEPFVGGGAMFFYLQGRYEIRESYLSDNNEDLIITYKVIKEDAQELIDELLEIEAHHLKKSEEKRKENYYRVREAYNSQKIDYQTISREWIERAAYFIFLNKTCFNGLYRLNSKGNFNVPFGRYKNPTICDGENLKEVQNALKKTVLFHGDFTESGRYVDDESFVYLDPPYRPLNKTSHFTSYSKDGFNDDSQKRLADYFKKMDQGGAKLMLSNSDPKNQDEGDKFFDDLYKDFKLERIPAKRNINRDASGRGKINELIVRNYP